MKREGSLTVIAVALIALFILVLIQIHADYRIGFRMGDLKARSKAHHFIRRRISPTAAGRYFEWLEKEEVKQ